MIVVRLDNPRFGAGPAVVIAHVSSVNEYHLLVRDRDGAIPEGMRLWVGEAPIGSQVKLEAATSVP